MRILLNLLASGFIVTTFAMAASREYTLNGAIAVFSALTAVAVPFLVATRYFASVCLTLGALVYLVGYIDYVKFSVMRLRLSYSDISIVAQFVEEGDFSIFGQYSNLVWPLAAGIALFVLLLTALIVAERRARAPLGRWEPVVAVLLVAPAILSIYWLDQSMYMTAVKSQFVQRLSADRAPLRVSSALAEVSETLSLVDLPLNCHPATIRASAVSVTPYGAG